MNHPIRQNPKTPCVIFRCSGGKNSFHSTSGNFPPEPPIKACYTVRWISTISNRLSMASLVGWSSQISRG